MSCIDKNKTKAACFSIVFFCAGAHADSSEHENIVELGYADVHFHTSTSDLEGPPWTTPPGIKTDINNTQVLALVYERRISGPWSVLLQGGIPPTLKVDAAGTAKSLGRVASAKAWFPAIILKYKFRDMMGFHPYIGAGINYTFYTNRHMTDAYTNAFGGTSSTVKLDNTWGGVIKFGVEFPIDENWVFDMGYSRYWIKNKATITTDTPGIGEIERTIKAQANPDAFGLMIGYKF